jgi:hypothetical protein
MCVAAVRSLPYNGRISRCPNINRRVEGKPIKSGHYTLYVQILRVLDDRNFDKSRS